MLNGAILRATEEIEVNVTFSEVSFSKVLWQFWAAFAAVFGYAVYSLIDLLCSEA